MIKRPAKMDVSADPGDNFLPGMAQAVDADFLVTGGNTRLLALSRHLFDRGPGLAGGDVRGEAADAGILCEAEVLAEPEDAVLQVSRLDRRRALDGRCRLQNSRIARNQPHQDAMTG